MHLMLDLETLGVGPNAAIIEVGAVLFEAKPNGKILNGKPFQMFVEPNKEARIDMSTVFWWFKQNPAARERFSKAYPAEFVSEVYVAKAFETWEAVQDLGGWSQIEGVWSHGAVFDQPLLESLFYRNGKRFPWHYAVSRDTRTLFSIIGGYPSIDNQGFVQHSAVDDCIMQAMMVQKAYAILRGVGHV